MHSGAFPLLADITKVALPQGHSWTPSDICLQVHTHFLLSWTTAVGYDCCYCYCPRCVNSGSLAGGQGVRKKEVEEKRAEGEDRSTDGNTDRITVNHLNNSVVNIIIHTLRMRKSQMPDFMRHRKKLSLASFHSSLPAFLYSLFMYLALAEHR